MAVMNKLTEIGLIIVSLAIGFLTFYLLSDLSKDMKKKQIDELLSQLINFVILVWVGKIVINLQTFIIDPFSVLAYPSDSKAFYFAVAAITLILLYKRIRKNFDLITFIHSFIYVFLFGSFVYEFIEVVFYNHPFAIGQLILISILIAIFLFIKTRFKVIDQIFILLTSLTIGILILIFNQPFITVFNYTIELWFVVLFYLVNSIGLMIYKRKRDT